MLGYSYEYFYFVSYEYSVLGGSVENISTIIKTSKRYTNIEDVYDRLLSDNKFMGDIKIVNFNLLHSREF